MTPDILVFENIETGDCPQVSGPDGVLRELPVESALERVGHLARLGPPLALGVFRATVVPVFDLPDIEFAVVAPEIPVLVRLVVVVDVRAVVEEVPVGVVVVVHRGAGLFGHLLCRALAGKRGTLAAPLEAARPGAGPAEGISLRVRDCDRRIIEGRLNVGNALGNVLLDLLFSKAVHRQVQGRESLASLHQTQSIKARVSPFQADL